MLEQLDRPIVAEQRPLHLGDQVRERARFAKLASQRDPVVPDSPNALAHCNIMS
jgi:hypothetical protein